MYVRDTFKRWFLLHFPSRHGKSNNFNEEELLREWDDLVQHCHHTLSQMQQMGGSTLTLLLLYCGTFYALNIGDSRIYRYTENRLYQITVDHSWAQLAFEHGMTAKEIESDSRRNSLTRCIGGGAKTAEADYFAGFYMDEDGFLLCSDGLRHLISVAELTVCLTEGYPQECLHQLVETAKKRGETDNLTGIAIKVNTVEG